MIAPTLKIQGTASDAGKSRMAEQLAEASCLPVTCIAAGQPGDEAGVSRKS